MINDLSEGEYNVSSGKISRDFFSNRLKDVQISEIGGDLYFPAQATYKTVGRIFLYQSHQLRNPKKPFSNFLHNIVFHSQARLMRFYFRRFFKF